MSTTPAMKQLQQYQLYKFYTSKRTSSKKPNVNVNCDPTTSQQNMAFFPVSNFSHLLPMPLTPERR
jgi:hypothetical protein